MKLLHSFRREIFRGLNADHSRLRQFQNKIEINIEAGNYLIKTAATKQEVIESLQLRHLVFIEEFIGKSNSTGLDIDRFDTFFDHLVVIEKKTSRVIATYRMLSSEFSRDFYSASEFNLSGLDTMQGPFLEIGRACVHPEHRRSIVLNLLWRGISEYLSLSGCEVLMGCGSVKTEDPAIAARLTRYFESRCYIAEQDFSPQSEYAMPDFQRQLDLAPVFNSEEEKQTLALVPPLFNSYLKAGAKVGRYPAWDREFKCVDFLILLKKSDIDSLYGKRFKIANKEN